MTGQEERDLIMSLQCPHCNKFRLKKINEERVLCPNCSRIWDIWGGFPNGYPVEETEPEKPTPKRSAIHNRD